MAMEDQSESVDDVAGDEAGPKRERSPNYPYLGLGAAIELTKILLDAAKASEIRVTDIAEPWGLSPKSGSLARYASAVAQFGLVTASGSGAKRRIRVSPIGRRIIEDSRPGVRESLCQEAALKPNIIRELFKGSDRITAWGHDRPIDNMAESALMFDLSFTPDAAKRFLGVYDETIKFIPKQSEGDELRTDDTRHDPKDEGEEPSGNQMSSPKSIKIGDFIQWTSNDQIQFSTPRRVRSLSDDGQWVFVEKSATGIPTHEVEVLGHIPKDQGSKMAAPTLAFAEQSEAHSELNKINFKSEGDGVISISARLDSEGLVLLEEKIAAFKLLLG
jgi:hypothetical protein